MLYALNRPYWQPEIETMDPEGLRLLQLARLQSQLKRCGATTFYQRLWAGSDFDPGGLQSCADLTRIPFTRKEDLFAAQVSEPPFGDLAWGVGEARCEIYPISTAGGALLYSAYAAADIERSREIGARILWAAGVRPSDLVHNSFGYGLFGGGLSIHRAAAAIGASIVPIGTDSVQRQVELLFNLNPPAIVAFPSRALYLADQIRERGLNPRDAGLRVGLFGGEPGVVGGRERLELVFGLKAYDLYGITEIATLLAAECSEQNGLHWAEDHVIVEVIDPVTMTPCRPGEIGVLVLTDLTRELMPLIRYWTGDLVALTDEPCPCGRTHARTPGGIRGRADEMAIFRGAKFYPARVEQVLYGFKELGAEYRIILERSEGDWADSCTVVVEEAQVAAHSSRSTEERLLRRLREEVHPDIGLRIVGYGSLDRTLRTARRVEDRRR